MVFLTGFIGALQSKYFFKPDLADTTFINNYVGSIHRTADGITNTPDGQYFYTYRGQGGGSQGFHVHTINSPGTLWNFPVDYTQSSRKNVSINGIRGDLIYVNNKLYITTPNNDLIEITSTGGGAAFTTYNETVSINITSNINYSSTLTNFESDGIYFDPPGRKLYISSASASTTDNFSVIMFTLSTPYNIAEIEDGTASLDTYILTTPGYTFGDRLRTIRFDEKGTNMFILNDTAGYIHHWRLPTAWDVSSITSTSFRSSLDVSGVSVGNDERGLTFQNPLNNGTKFYITFQKGSSNSDVAVYKFNDICV